LKYPRNDFDLPRYKKKNCDVPELPVTKNELGKVEGNEEFIFILKISRV
jgi:hypothetical protein